MHERKNTESGVILDICVLNPFFYPYSGGTEKVLLEIYKRIAKRHNVCVLSASFGKYKGVERRFGIKIVRLPTTYLHLPHLPMPLPIMHGLNAALAKEKPEICHINNRYLYYARTLNVISRLGAKLVTTIHNALPRGIDPLTDLGGLLYDILWGRKIMSSSAAIPCITRYAMESTVPKKLRYKAKVIYNGIDMKRYKPRPKDRAIRALGDPSLAESEIILNVARLTTQKGQIYLLRAFSALLKEFKDLKLIIVGSGPLKRTLEAEAYKLGVQRAFKIVTGAAEAKLPYYYNSASVFALPSLYEPASLALLEALASGVPTIASRVGGIPEMMKDAGRYVEPRDVEGLANAIRDALTDKAKNRLLTRKGLALMRKEHDWDKIANEYETLFINL